jgi:hypothetical protein
MTIWLAADESFNKRVSITHVPTTDLLIVGRRLRCGGDARGPVQGSVREWRSAFDDAPWCRPSARLDPDGACERPAIGRDGGFGSSGFAIHRVAAGAGAVESVHQP